ncbi:MAG: CHC2 zinc finger domain-containing protein, partial [bacterium]|nr:CHC2 zinc finger domain-containing protein [bacterium]
MSSPIEEIKSRLSAADVVGSYVRLFKAGQNFKALCPFHNEKTPSFYVSPSRDIWHCFGCSKGGDIFAFIKEIEGADFPEALELLASRAGVILKKEDPSLLTERRRYFFLLEEAVKFYEAELAKRLDVLDYLKERGLTEETIKSFR